MRKLTQNLILKIIAILLFVVFTSIAVLSFFTTVYIAEKGFYTGQVGSIYETDWCKNLTYDYASRAFEYYMELFHLRQDNESLGAPTPGHYDDIGTYLSSTADMYKRELADTNFRFIAYSPDGTELFGTYQGEKHGYTAAYDFSYSFDINGRWETDEYGNEYYVTDTQSSFVMIRCYVLDPLTYTDEYTRYKEGFDLLYENRVNILILMGVSVIISILTFIFLLLAAGRRKGCDAVRPNLQDRIPLELYLGAVGLAGVLIVNELSYFNYGYWRVSDIFETSVLCIALLILFLMTAMTLATRFKLGAFWKNTILYRLIRLVWWLAKRAGRALRTVARAIPFIWKGILFIFFVMGMEVVFYICALADLYLIAPLCVLFHVVLLILLIVMLTNMSRLHNSGKKMAEGNFEYSTDRTGLFGPFGEHADHLNSIRAGMAKAVDARMQSERMKTELITNVSHDIKTPLTSIINYVDLLKKENIEGEAAKEYLDVLDRQSARLKKLIVDLVEASKASTGNITATPVPTNAGEILCQAMVEYNERMEQSGLDAVMRCDDSLRIMADGRLLWRVLDNLLGNVCKYSKEGTRVYIDGLADGAMGKITVKNISNTALNIDPEELMERFVRGDESRTTEGSGLGLSIARSLTELMGGRLNLFIDGDLFKVELRFPLVK